MEYKPMGNDQPNPKMDVNLWTLMVQAQAAWQKIGTQLYYRRSKHNKDGIRATKKYADGRQKRRK